MILGQNFKFFETLSLDKMVAEMMSDDVFWVATSSSRPYTEMSNFGGRHRGFFSKGVSLLFWVKIINFL